MTEKLTMRRQRSRHQNLAMMAVALAIAVTGGDVSARPTSQTAAITYQGLLKSAGGAVNGSVDLQFKLFDAAAAGNQVGSTLASNAVVVVDGVFTSSLDFGALAYNGEERWLEISVASPAGGGIGPFTTLSPRQKLASAPYAAFALNALLPATYGHAVNFSNAGNAFNGVFTGSGFGLTSLNPLALSGLIDSSNIGGTYGNALALSNASNTFNGSFSGSGAALTSLNAANIASGNLNVARMPTGGAWTLASNLNINANALVVEQATGEVGIGTATPTVTLEVVRTPPSNNIGPVAIFRQAGATSSVGAVRFQNSAGNHFNLGITTANEFALGYNSNISLSGDLLRMTSTGNLGIGTISPAAKLHVAGNARIDGTITLPATVRNATLHASMFQPSSNATAFTISPSRLSCTTSAAVVRFFAPVTLPDGAVITSVVGFVDDDSPNQDMTFSLVALDLTTGVSATTGAASSSGGTVFGTDPPQQIAITGLPLTADNTTTAYAVQVDWTVPSGPTGGSLALCGARVTYSVTQPLP